MAVARRTLARLPRWDMAPGTPAARVTLLAAVAPAHGLIPPSVRLASADASFRRYFRVGTLAGSAGPAATCIIMDAPPEREDCGPFVKVAHLMVAAGLPAPRILAWLVRHTRNR